MYLSKQMYMKRFFLLFSICVLSVCMSTGCSDDDNPEELPVPDPDPELTLTPNTPIVFSAEGGSVEITVTTNMKTWNAVSDYEWCKVAVSAGKLTVSALKNEIPEPMPAATVTVTATSDERSISSKLQVSQEAAEIKYTDLSDKGTANCYLITAAGNYSINATVRGNGATTEGLDAPTAIAGTSAALVWQSTPNLISGVTLSEGRINFKISGPGNAVIAVKADETILWSWHIWYPEAEVAGLNSKAGYEVMNMNLGAMHNKPGDIGSYGLLYQWGRKDPFPAAPTLTGTTETIGAPIYDENNRQVTISNSSWSSTSDNNLAFAIANPTVCLSNYSQYSTSRDWLQADMSNDALWGNPRGAERDGGNYPNKGAKSFYDPCPVGWRVPPVDVFRSFTTSGGYAWVIDDFDIVDVNGDGQKTIDDYNYGWTFNLSDNTSSYFAAAARFDGSYAMLMGSMSGLWGSYWGNAPYPGDMFQGGAYSVLSFQIADMNGQEMITTSPLGGGARADAYSVRCIRESDE